MSADDIDLPVFPDLPEVPGRHQELAPAQEGDAGALQGLLAELPPDEQLAILKEAMRFGVRDASDPMYGLMVALSYHLRAYEQIPAKIQEILGTVRETSTAAVASIENTMDESMRHMLVVRDAFKADIREEMAAQKRDLELTITKMVTPAVTNSILGKDTKEALQKVTLAAARGIGIGYIARWTGITVIAVLIAVVGAYDAGRTHVDPAAQIARGYYDQLTCRPNGAQRICALTADPRQVVVFQEPR